MLAQSLTKKILEVLQKEDKGGTYGAGNVMKGKRKDFRNTQTAAGELGGISNIAQLKSMFLKGDLDFEEMLRKGSNFIKAGILVGGARTRDDNQVMKAIRELIKRHNKKLTNKKLVMNVKRGLKSLIDNDKFDMDKHVPKMKDELIFMIEANDPSEIDLKTIMGKIIIGKAAMKPKGKKRKNPWIDHVKSVQKAQGITFAKAMKIAGKTWKKGVEITGTIKPNGKVAVPVSKVVLAKQVAKIDKIDKEIKKAKVEVKDIKAKKTIGKLEKIVHKVTTSIKKDLLTSTMVPTVKVSIPIKSFVGRTKRLRAKLLREKLKGLRLLKLKDLKGKRAKARLRDLLSGMTKEEQDEVIKTPKLKKLIKIMLDGGIALDEITEIETRKRMSELLIKQLNIQFGTGNLPDLAERLESLALKPNAFKKFFSNLSVGFRAILQTEFEVGEFAEVPPTEQEEIESKLTTKDLEAIVDISTEFKEGVPKFVEILTVSEEELMEEVEREIEEEREEAEFEKVKRETLGRMKLEEEEKTEEVIFIDPHEEEEEEVIITDPDDPKGSGRRTGGQGILGGADSITGSGRRTGGRHTAGRVSGGRHTAGRVSGGRHTAGRVSGGRVTAGGSSLRTVSKTVGKNISNIPLGGKRGKSSWISHVKRTASKFDLSWKDALIVASKTWKKQTKIKGIAKGGKKTKLKGVKKWQAHVKAIAQQLPGVGHRDIIKIASATFKMGGQTTDISFELRQEKPSPFETQLRTL